MATFVCARCSTSCTAGRLPRNWRLRGGEHICGVCWLSEPAERSAVWRYRALRVEVPETFWREQRAARRLWDGLVALSDEALAEAVALRSTYAPEAGQAAREASEAAAQAWAAVREARRAGGDGLAEIEHRARGASARAAELYAAAKRAAKAAGCDESEVWRRFELALSQAPMWTYAERDVDGRRVVERVGDADTTGAAAAWRLPRGHADQVVDEFRAAWRAWIAQRPKGRRRPSRHGLALRDRVRHVLRYTNGMDWARLERGTPSCTIKTLATDERGRSVVRIEFAGGLAVEFVLHRPVPTDRDGIRCVRLVGTRVLDRWEWDVLFTCRTAARRAEPDDVRADAVAVDLRWRMDEDERGYLVVAGWRDTDGGWGYVMQDRDAGNARQRKCRWPLPSSWSDFLRLASEVDHVFEWAKAGVWAAHGQALPYSQPFRLMRAEGLIRAWKRGDYPMADAGLTAWAAWHRTQRNRLERCRQRVLARRDQQYYIEARRIAASARVIVLESEREREQAMDLRPLIADAKASGQRQFLAPGRFREILARVAPEYGAEVVLVEKHRTSTTCPECGGQAEAGGSLRLTCERGHRFDQIEAACRELLRRWRERRDDGEKAGGARVAQVGEHRGDVPSLV